MRILLLGNTGQLGWELQRCLLPLGDVNGLDYPEIDLSNPGQGLREMIRAAKPEIIVNATAYTAVDVAESRRDLAYAINATSSAVMAEEAKALGATLIHYSTDYVFDGSKGGPYIETDTPNPLNVYGSSKLEGEQAVQSAGGSHLIFRTAWVYSLRRESFVTKSLLWARENETLRVVDDQVSNPTSARMLAEITAQLLARGRDHVSERAGLYHLAGDGFTSRLGWTRLILELDPGRGEQKTREILPASTADFPTPARRPLFSALNCDRFAAVFGLRLPNWQLSLRLAMQG
ncbi:MAG: dTDP-4-dehydrorhamnose reductase [Chloroflexi bacterium]|nr:dTDP-4-dehydrorhamnose reductase [Chloroflexota bacterium]